MSGAGLEQVYGAIPRPGEIVADKYRVEKVIGAGAMGVVVLARHEQLGRRVAIKFIAPSLHSEVARARFRREARAIASLESEHVVRVLDFGELPENVLYMVMEHLVGRNLEEHTRGRRVPIADAVDWVIQAAAGVSAAHARAIVHRDIKPANLFLALGAHGVRTVKVLDFGIAKADAIGERDASITESDASLGSPAYMSPEQIRQAKTVGVASDVWSLGAVLFRFLAGTTPFHGTGTSAVLASIVADAPKRLRDFAPDAPPALAQIVERCLEKRPEWRPPSCDALVEALAPFGSPASSVVLQRLKLAASARADVLDSLDGDRASFSELETVDGPADQPAAGERTSITAHDDAGTVAPTELMLAPARNEATTRRRRGRFLVAAFVVASLVATAGVVVASIRAPSAAPSAVAPSAVAPEAPSVSTSEPAAPAAPAASVPSARTAPSSAPRLAAPARGRSSAPAPVRAPSAPLLDERVFDQHF